MSATRHRIAIFGASGYAGMELQALLAHHPHVEVALATSDRLTGGVLRDRVAGCEVALLATPPEASRELAPELVRAGVRAIDLSNAFRFDASAVYGLPELSERAEIVAAKLVANPGCYPTAAALALAPLFVAGAIAPDVIVDAMSGVTGAGRRADEAYSFVALHADARAYRVLRHQHQPEIAQSLARAAGAAVDVTFTPHLVPLARGILATCYARATRDVAATELADLFTYAYRGEPFVRVVATADDVAVAHVVGTNVCEVGVACEGRRVVVTAAIDNLVKGAAGQAIQNLNAMLGVAETTSLLELRRWHP